ncbi:Uncharacterized protein conserved in bacteria [Mycoplasmopsis citelli]|uniref:Uncharacterized protein conserved in bacteria n=1 Tax=Mycoplasmopsis citelli TaxID=171281 RepID=A0A449B2K1_9BACT|nr:DUF2130 domain-containing protein [Mycoplasmopsis citelli]VEU74754.1 Uncharacterized protein conserved in bacteria [Mycoplasmopsis citelli]
MSKKLSIEIKDVEKLQFFIKETAQEGDYIDLNDLLNKDFTNIHSFKSDLTEKLKNMYKQSFLQEYEQTKKQENEKTISLIENNLKLEFEAKKEKEIQDQKDQFTQELSKKESELVKVKSDLESLKIQKEEQEKRIDLIKKDLQNEIENQKNIEIQGLKFNYEQQINQKENEIVKLKTNLEIEKSSAEQKIKDTVENEVGKRENDLIRQYEEKLRNEVKEKEIKISSLERELNDFSKMSTKMIGEDLENKVEDRLREMFAPFREFVKFGKITKAKSEKNADETSLEGKKTKADFYVEFLSKKTQESIGKIIIECKSQESDKGTTKNSDHFKKLEKDRNKENAHFALLVTNLEANKEFFVYTPNEDEYQKIVVLRLPFLGSVLSLFYSYFEKLEMSKINEESVQRAQAFMLGAENIKKVFIDSLKGLKDRQEEIFKAINGLRSQTDKLEKLVDKMVRIDLNKIYKSLTFQRDLPSEFLLTNFPETSEEKLKELPYEELISK